MTRRTSIDTYRKLQESGILTPLRRTVWNGLYKHGPCTANELVIDMKVQDNKSTKSRDYFAQRLSELRAQGAVRELPKRVCRITGHMAIVWETTDNTPLKLLKPKKIKCKSCNGRGHHLQEKLI